MTEKVRHNSKSPANQPMPVQQPMQKRWILAKRYFGNTKRQLDNERLEACFMNVVSQVKKLLKGQDFNVFERDYRRDNSENAFVLHTFMSKNVFLYLECTLNYVYTVDFALFKCPQEEAIRKLLDNPLLSGRKKEVELQPTFIDFYLHVLDYQPEQYIFSL